MSKARSTGTRFESLVCAYLVEHGFPYAERRALRGARDAGDIAGIPGVVLECKALKALDVAGAVDEAKKQAGHVQAPIWAAILKRRNKPVSAAYVVMDLEAFCSLIGER